MGVAGGHEETSDGVEEDGGRVLAYEPRCGGARGQARVHSMDLRRRMSRHWLLPAIDHHFPCTLLLRTG